MLSTFFGIQKAPVRFKLKKGYIRDEEMQARELVDQKTILWHKYKVGLFRT